MQKIKLTLPVLHVSMINNCTMSYADHTAGLETQCHHEPVTGLATPKCC